MSAQEFAEWLAFDSVQPLPDRQAEFATARLLSQQHNMHCRKETDRVRAIEMMPDYWKVPETASDTDADDAKRVSNDIRRNIFKMKV